MGSEALPGHACSPPFANHKQVLPLQQKCPGLSAKMTHGVPQGLRPDLNSRQLEPSFTLRAIASRPSWHSNFSSSAPDNDPPSPCNVYLSTFCHHGSGCAAFARFSGPQLTGVCLLLLEPARARKWLRQAWVAASCTRCMAAVFQEALYGCRVPRAILHDERRAFSEKLWIMLNMSCAAPPASSARQRRSGPAAAACNSSHLIAQRDEFMLR